jgi:hypothetical protein
VLYLIAMADLVVGAALEPLWAAGGRVAASSAARAGLLAALAAGVAVWWRCFRPISDRCAARLQKYSKRAPYLPPIICCGDRSSSHPLHRRATGALRRKKLPPTGAVDPAVLPLAAVPVAPGEVQVETDFYRLQRATVVGRAADSQGGPGVPQDPLAPRPGPLGSSRDRESAIGNAPARVPG